MEKDDAMSRNDVPLIENNLDFLPFAPDAVILADGEYPVHEYPLRLLRETPYIVCCDGAANTFISYLSRVYSEYDYRRRRFFVCRESDAL